ncbi:hypothetical protein B0H66DRAFT_210591 [Apodospora peruviana]|uniref:Erythromycin esterase n=1 Tax=Apodospora peruviana TaxID=516989 RepID=A0AAE0ICU6_9PEZI|nr:hypothetical protein B0H66DRAFT_210591 [Apodospora peruviana]
MARRSARLASVSRPPKLTDDNDNSKLLASVAERDDSPDEGVTPSLNELVSSPAPAPKTPGHSSPVKPPMSEMHPSKVHQTMAAPSSGLRLGFTDIKPTADRHSNLPAAVLSTPTKIGPPTSAFTFRSARQATSDLKLGPEAQRLMDELRGEASKIKAQLAAQRDAERLEEDEGNTRKIATAKGKAGRFSSAHMAEFKKMDSIANHPSAFRAQPGRVTPLKQGIKRSQSKANLDHNTPQKQGIKRSQSKANLDDSEPPRAKQPTAASSTAKPSLRTAAEILSPVKRARQHIDDDASSNRPVSRDGSGLPRPKSSGMGSAIPRSKSSLASLMTPTKSSLARTATAKTPAQSTLARSPSKATLGGIPRSATTNNLPPVAKAEPEEVLALPPSVEIRSPSRFDRVKSMLRGSKQNTAKARSALPLPSALGSKTPGPPVPPKDIPAAPLTTPARKLTKRVAFTPETHRGAPTTPSPVKSAIPRSKSRPVLGEVFYPPLDAVMAEEMIDRGLAYPDLSGHRPLPEPPIKDAGKTNSAKASAPGTFTFRSDHTISFGSTSPSFGTSPGQSSIRPVRPSILPTENMPGSFPNSIINISSPNKENEAPRTVFLGMPHGMKSKKRNRPSTDEEEAEQEAAERAAKKRKQETVPEGDALLAPRLMAAASSKRVMTSPKKLLSPGYAASPRAGGGGIAGTPSPMKKRAMISLSRLHMLSRPKRK